MRELMLEKRGYRVVWCPFRVTSNCVTSGAVMVRVVA